MCSSDPVTKIHFFIHFSVEKKDSGFRVQMLQRQYIMLDQIKQFACFMNILDQPSERDRINLDCPDPSLKRQ